MNTPLQKQLISIAQERYSSDDPSHDFSHITRVLRNAIQICDDEGADLEIVIPAALFHDLITYPKNDPRSKEATKESAHEAGIILMEIREFPKHKIQHVQYAIEVCSYSKGITPETLEAKIVQDADRLEATGAISIMRTFCSSGTMKRPFYHTDDPFCEKREPEDLHYSLDLFYTRLLKVESVMHTQAAQKIAKRRTVFLRQFIDEVKEELKGH